MNQIRLTWSAVLFFWAVPSGAGEGPVIIDVPSTEEFQRGRYEGALHMPYERIGSMIGDQVEDKNTPIVLYCRSGRRAGIAAETLAGLDYTNVENAGGLDDLWKLPVQKQESEKCVGDC